MPTFSQIFFGALGAASVAHAGTFEKFSDRGCSLSLGTNQVPQELGCTQLQSDTGDGVFSIKASGPLAANCFISFYTDESCGQLSVTVDEANASEGELFQLATSLLCKEGTRGNTCLFSILQELVKYRTKPWWRIPLVDVKDSMYGGRTTLSDEVGLLHDERRGLDYGVLQTFFYAVVVDGRNFMLPHGLVRQALPYLSQSLGIFSSDLPGDTNLMQGLWVEGAF